MGTDLIIREADADDWKAIQRLNLQIFEFELECCELTSNTDYPFTEEGIEYYKKSCEKRDGHQAIVAELGKFPGIVGYAIIKQIPDNELTHRIGVKQFQLHTLSVDEKHRNSGIGRKLVEYCIQISKSSGANRLKVVAYAPNQRARHLYKSCGFTELEVTHEISL